MTAYATGPRLVTLSPERTYATQESAINAVHRVYPPDNPQFNHLTYILQQTPLGRFYPVFVGERATLAQAHFHFCVVS